MPIDFEKVKELIALVEQNGLTELTIEEDGITITIKAESPSPEGAQVAHAPSANPGAQVHAQPIEIVMGPLVESEDEAVEIPHAKNLVQITSPMIGVFYRRPSPDSPYFIEVGDEIEVGQTIGLIEAMKVFSEVPSEIAGRVIAIPTETAKLVQQGDVLVVVDVSRGDG